MSGAGSGADTPEIEIVGSDDARLSRAAAATLDRLGVRRWCHVAVEIVDEQRIQELNREHRGKDAPTDVLSFPVDGEWIAGGEQQPRSDDDAPLELGDVVICPAHTEDMVEATVHGVLHLCGYDHETDEGEMLDLQDQIMELLDEADESR